MSNEAILNQITDWHIVQEHENIIKAILDMPEHERSSELICLLARAMSNEDDYSSALKVLDSIRDNYSNDPYFCLRYGFALYNLHREHEALNWFKKANTNGLEEINETPGTFLPKSVTQWIERAERWAPRRIEKNAFEAEYRTKRNTRPQDSRLSDFDFAGFWNDCDYSLKRYIGRIPTDTDITEAEAMLGYRLPASYKALISQHNGGLLKKNCFENPLQRDWTPRTFGIENIYGIDSDKSNSLCGDMGSKFWIKEWGYPDIGVAICGCPSGGHDMIFLDYTDCGPEGEPCVVHIAQESNYEITYLADCFEDFVRGLVPMEEDDE